jgi:Na+/H+ antiporter NhaD/arsenite permease-like protein
MDTLSKWLVPAAGFVIGLLMAAALLGQHASVWQAGLSFVIVAAYAMGLRLLQSRSETASLLSGMPVDERWESINTNALAMAGAVMAVVLVAAFLITQFLGGDSMTYAWLGAVFALMYLGGILWYRWRQ